MGPWGAPGQEFEKAIYQAPMTVVDNTSGNMCFVHHQATQEASPRVPGGRNAGSKAPAPLRGTRRGARAWEEKEEGASPWPCTATARGPKPEQGVDTADALEVLILLFREQRVRVLDLALSQTLWRRACRG